jgi:hypothetical protein
VHSIARDLRRQLAEAQERVRELERRLHVMNLDDDKWRDISRAMMTEEPMTETNHGRGCPALQAWDIPGACNCDGPEPEPEPERVDIEELRRRNEQRWADIAACDPAITVWAYSTAAVDIDALLDENRRLRSELSRVLEAEGMAPLTHFVERLVAIHEAREERLREDLETAMEIVERKASQPIRTRRDAEDYAIRSAIRQRHPEMLWEE